MRRRQGANKFETRKFTGGKELTAYSARNGYVDYLEIGGDAWQRNVTGAQLFDIASVKNGYVAATSVGTKVLIEENNEDYPNAQYVVVTLSERIISYSFSKIIENGKLRIVSTDNDGIRTESVLISEKKENFSVKENTTVLYIMSLNGFKDADGYGMMNYGEKLLPWEPYTHGEIAPSPSYPQEIIGLTNPSVHAKNTVTYPYTLYGMGDVKDRLIVDKAHRRAWIERHFKSVTLNGTENWVTYSTYEGFALDLEGLAENSSRVDGYCNRFKIIKNNETVEQIGVWLGVGNNRMYIVRVREYATTLDEWKRWVSENNISVLYPLSSAEIEEIPWQDALLLITQLGDNIISLVDVNEHLSPVLEVHTKVLPYCYKNMVATGNPAIFDTTINKPIEVEATGWTKQDATTGANMLSNNPESWEMQKKTSWGADLGTVINPLEVKAYYATIKFSVKPSTKYSFKNLETENLWLARIIECDSSNIGWKNHNLYSNVETQNKETYTFSTTENTTALYVSIRTLPETGNGESRDITEGDILNNKICFSEGEPKYEEYTGNKPSPSPEYPQEIKSEGVWNVETQKYERTIRVSNKNLFDRTYASNKENWKNGENYPYISIFVGKGNAVSFCYSNDLELGLGLYVLISKEPGSTPKSYRWLYHSTTESLINKSGSFVAENNEIYLSVAGANSTLLEKFMENIGDHLQMEISESATAYVEHAEQSVTITSDRPVSKWDRLECRDGVYGWAYKQWIYTFTGEEKFIVPAGAYVGENSCNSYFTNAEKKKGGTGFCDKLKEVAYAWSNDLEYDAFCFNADQIHVRILNEKLGITKENTGEEIKDAIKRYLKKLHDEGNPVKICGESATEEFVPLQEEEQAALKALFSYSPTTVMTNDTGMFMQVEYQTKEGNGEEV